jgi:hypothetical protein
LQQEDPQQGSQAVEGKREPKQRILQQVSHVREMSDGRRDPLSFEQELSGSENERDTDKPTVLRISRDIPRSLDDERPCRRASADDVTRRSRL